MRDTLLKHWFLCALAVVVAGGAVIGRFASPELGNRLLPGIPWESAAAEIPRTATAVVLFFMSFTLDGRQLRNSLRAPGPALWATLVTFGIVPLLGWALMPLQSLPDFRIGVMIAACVPCTMAAAAVWTRRAGGNDAVSLMVTLVTNALCFVVTPFWLQVTTGNTVHLDGASLMRRLLTAVLAPILIGQACRTLKPLRRLADSYKRQISAAAQLCILAIVLVASCKAGAQLEVSRGGNTAALFGAVAWVGVCTVALHLAAMWIGWSGAKRLQFQRPERIAVAFAASQKTLPIGILLATDPGMFGNPDLLGPGCGVPFAVFPVLIFHTSQLFIDTAIADRMARQVS